mgnify:CR=1 FL=1
MIDTINFKEMLLSLGFNENGKNTFSKTCGESLDSVLVADFDNKKLRYPEQIRINDQTTSNFEHPENFVVFECVARLLQKGYRPEHIELEKRWNLGHEAKGGKADICVYDADGKNMLLIIECKTFGTEYNKERKQTLADGGQLFSYWQQERSTKWLALYASDFNNGNVIFENEIINCSDDNNLIELAKKDETLLLYQRAYSAREKFEVWKETYQQAFYRNLIFGDDTVAYHIGVRPLRKSDLKDFCPNDKIVNRFEEILRHNNVSDKENAFNRLTALFICKLVDEIGKSDDQELEFQYKQGTDTYESLQDRLQRLHQKGMNDFMKEKIFYVANDYAENLVQQYAGRQRKAMIEDLQKTIRILKFYSNNDFSFKDVHNEELFLQNGKVLVEVVQLFENYRIVYPSKHQFLGDLFEQLLNKGFKQNEGQFFTPMPLTRFIWDSLPLETIVHNTGKYNLPKVIDFACGAGHFLTEAVEAVNAYLKRNGQEKLTAENAWVEKAVFGVEKDYRLARVSKISLFMNGAGYGNIIFGDGLENYPEKQIEPGTFDILVANPPYAVSAFKGHLKKGVVGNYELAERITDDGSEIEVLFVERISQLLKPKGIAAVFLPASILSNSSNSYIGARESLLENFKIRAIAQFGSKTFGATGTNTIIAFLEKYDEPPKRKEIVWDSVNAIQDGRDIVEWEDREILTAYLAKIQVTEADYRKFQAGKEAPEFWTAHSYFGQFEKAFFSSAEVKKRKTQTVFKKLPLEEQNRLLRNMFYRFVRDIEAEKLKFFALVYKQTTLVVTAPSGNDEQKEFLGYDWSNRKGAEGIQILHPGGKLYNDSDRMADNTTASAVRSSFNDQPEPVPELDKYLAWLRLQDMIDFSRLDFNKEIKTTISKRVEIQSKWPLNDLGDLFDIIRGVTYSKDLQVIEETDNIVLPADNITLDGVLQVTKPIFLKQDYVLPEEKRLKKDDCFMCFSSGSKSHVGKITFISQDTKYYAGGFMGILRTKDSRIEAKFLAYLLGSEQYRSIIQNNSTGSNINNLSNEISHIKIPLPPLDIQKKIVEECEKVDAECDKARKEIEEYQKKIVDVMTNVKGEKKQIVELCKVNPPRSEISMLPENTIVSFVGMASVSNDGYIENKIDRPLYELKKGSYTYFAEGDIIIAKITPCMENGKCAVANNLTNKIGMGSSEFHVFRCNEEINNYFLFGFLNRDNIRKAAEKQMTGASGHRRVPITFYENLQIPVPSLAEQKEIVTEIEEYEKKISKAKAIMSSAQEQKNQILTKWL